MVRILFWRRLVINLASFVAALEQKTRDRRTVNGSKCRRWNGKLAEGVIFLAHSFHIQNCARCEFSFNLNPISKIRTEVQIEIQLRIQIRIFELKFKLSSWKLDWKFELQSTDLCVEVEIQVSNSRANFQDRVKKCANLNPSFKFTFKLSTSHPNCQMPRARRPTNFEFKSKYPNRISSLRICILIYELEIRKLERRTLSGGKISQGYRFEYALQLNWCFLSFFFFFRSHDTQIRIEYIFTDRFVGRARSWSHVCVLRCKLHLFCLTQCGYSRGTVGNV